MQTANQENPDFWKREPISDDFNRASDFDTWLFNLLDRE
jgi:hypothetical protein